MAAGMNGMGPVVVGIDGSKPSLAALRQAMREAEWRGVELHVMHVLDVSPAVLHLRHDQTITTRELAESDRQEVWSLASPILDEAEVEVVRVDRDGEPGKAMSAYCAEVGASIAVVAPRGRGRVKEMLLGSTATQVAKTAACDVLLVKSGS